jgi:uncharacterized protein
MDTSPPPVPPIDNSPRPANQDEKTLGIVMHVLSLVGLAIVGPLVIWLMKKDQSAFLDAQGRELLNFQVSYLIYWFVAFLLCFVLVGFLLVFVLAIASIVLTIIGIVKSADGVIYRFPLTIRMF